MPRKKICTVCGWINSPSDPECRRCGIDITGIKAVNYSDEELKRLESSSANTDQKVVRDDGPQPDSAKNPSENNPVPEIQVQENAPSSTDESDVSSSEFSEKKAVKICPSCGAVNPRIMRKCTCGADIRYANIEYINDGTAASAESGQDDSMSAAGGHDGSAGSRNQQINEQNNKQSSGDSGQSGTPAGGHEGSTGSRNQQINDQNNKQSSGDSGQSGTSAGGLRMMKICPNCKSLMGEKVKLCSNCFADLRNVSAQAVDQSQTAVPERKVSVNSTVAVLFAPDGREIFTVKRNNPVVILGRENEMASYLADFNYVSRKHCELKVYEGIVVINDGGSTNGTYVNNKRIQSMKDEQLKDGDRISLGGLWDCGDSGCFTIKYPDR
jgi:ribosomal protein L40E